jgi:hypothetical protein
LQVKNKPREGFMNVQLLLGLGSEHFILNNSAEANCTMIMRYLLMERLLDQSLSVSKDFMLGAGNAGGFLLLLLWRAKQRRKTEFITREEKN